MAVERESGADRKDWMIFSFVIEKKMLSKGNIFFVITPSLPAVRDILHIVLLPAYKRQYFPVEPVPECRIPEQW